jgi:hypothetical protein
MAEARRVIGGSRPPILDEEGAAAAMEHYLRAAENCLGARRLMRAEGFRTMDRAARGRKARIHVTFKHSPVDVAAESLFRAAS